LIELAIWFSPPFVGKHGYSTIFFVFAVFGLFYFSNYRFLSSGDKE